MITPEEKAKKWLKHVNGWLNQFGESSLSDSAVVLLSKLKKDFERSELKKAWDIIDDLNRLSDMSEGLNPLKSVWSVGLLWHIWATTRMLRYSFQLHLVNTQIPPSLCSCTVDERLHGMAFARKRSGCHTFLG